MPLSAHRLAHRLLGHEHEPCLRCAVTNAFWRVEPLRYQHGRHRLFLAPFVALLRPAVVPLTWAGWVRAVFGMLLLFGRPAA